MWKKNQPLSSFGESALSELLVWEFSCNRDRWHWVVSINLHYSLLDIPSSMEYIKCIYKRYLRWAQTELFQEGIGTWELNMKECLFTDAISESVLIMITSAINWGRTMHHEYINGAYGKGRSGSVDCMLVLKEFARHPWWRTLILNENEKYTQYYFYCS